jgi:hypothetical protein
MAEAEDENESRAKSRHTAPTSQSPPPDLSDAEMLRELALCPYLLHSSYSTLDELRPVRAMLLRWKRLGFPNLESLRAQNFSASAEAPQSAESHPDSLANGLRKSGLRTTTSSVRGYWIGTWKTSSCISLAMGVLRLIIAPRVVC